MRWTTLDPVARRMGWCAVRWAVMVSLPVCVVSGVVGGGWSAASSLTGAMLALAGFVGGVWAVGAVIDNAAGALVPQALLVYMVQISLLVWAALAVTSLSWMDGAAGAAGVLSAAMGYQVGHVRGFLTARIVMFPTVCGADGER